MHKTLEGRHARGPAHKQHLADGLPPLGAQLRLQSCPALSALGVPPGGLVPCKGCAQIHAGLQQASMIVAKASSSSLSKGSRVWGVLATFVSQRRDDNLCFYQRRQLCLALSDTLRFSHHPHSMLPLTGA